MGAERCGLRRGAPTDAIAEWTASTMVDNVYYPLDGEPARASRSS